MYQDAVFTISLSLYCLQYMPVRRLSLSMSQAAWMLTAIIPFVKDGTKSPKKEILFPDLPYLKYLKIVWHTGFPELSHRPASLPQFRRTLTRLRFFKRSFEVEIKIFAQRSQDEQVVCTATITDTSTKFVYCNGVEKKSEFEQNVALLICTGALKEDEDRFDRITSRTNCLRVGEPMTLGDAAATGYYINFVSEILEQCYDE